MKNTPKHNLLAGFAALLTATTLLGAEPKPDTARAILPTDPGHAFMMNAKIGVFVHYTAGQSDFAYGKPNPQPWDLDAHADAFDVKAFADAVEDMGAQYVIMTSFHAAMRLLGPSKVMVDIGMPTHQSKRDMLGDLADELNRRNIALCLYVHPTDQHDLSQEERALFGWGPEVDGLPGEKLGQWPNPKWDAFLLGLFKEISQRYGKRVSGYWIDQHTGKLFPEAGRLAVALRSGNPDAVIWQNSGAYVPAGLSLEDAWCAPEGGQFAHGADDQHCLLPLKGWWFQSDEVVVPVEELFRAVARHNGCPGKKCGVDIGLTPYATGYAPKVKAMMAEFGKLWRERKVSLLNTRPSTILKIEQKAVPWPIVATDSLDGSTVYVHVLIPPTGKSIKLPALADGRKIISSSLLLGGNEVKFKQTEEAVELSLPEDVKWDPVDTVIVLKVGPAFEPGVLLSENAKLEISSTCGHDVAANHAEVAWKKMMTVAERKRDAQGNLLPLQSYDETIRRGMDFLLKDHLKWFKGPTETLLDEKGRTQMPWVYYSNLQQDGTPFPKAVDGFVSYPAFHHALLIRTFLGYWRYAKDERALAEAVKLADWDIAHSTPADWPYGNFPWSTFQEKKPGGFLDKTGLMPDKAAIMALAYLQLHEATGEKRFLQAADAIARTLAARQRPNGTWPFRVDPQTEQVIEEYTSSVIYAVRLFESLDKLNGNDRYRANRDKTWNWLLNGPIKTKEFRGFYEDIPASQDGRTNYDCLDTIRYLLANRTDTNGYIEMAKDLNLWIEKTFMDKIKDFEPAEGIREQLQCNVVMGIHSLNWASMLLDLANATGDEKLRQRAMQTANYITYYLQPDSRIVVGFQYNQWWYSCHAGVVLYLLDFEKGIRKSDSKEP